MDSSTALGDLPDELLLEIAHHLDAIRSYEPQSTAFKHKKTEKRRQLENRARRVGLYSLCLTSHRMRRVATPSLYQAFCGSSTWYGFTPLKLFHRTVSAPENLVGLHVHPAAYLEYLENRLSDYAGNSLYDDTEFYGAVHLVTQYFWLLADVTKYAQNLQHLSVVSLETDEASFWNYILPEHLTTWTPQASPAKIANHGLQNLRTLCFQIHTEGYGFGLEAAWMPRVCSAVKNVPTLVDVRASGVVSGSPMLPAFNSFKQLQRLEIRECSLDVDDVVEIWLACQGLRHIVCEWAFLNGRQEAPSDLFPGLIAHASTLETLSLDMREVRFAQFSPESFPFLGSLTSFRRLHTLTICETSLLGNYIPLEDFPDQIVEHRISDLLPANLQSLDLLLRNDYGIEGDCRLDEVISLWNLAEDLKARPTQMRNFGVNATFQLCAPNLEKAFVEAGVEFYISKQATGGEAEYHA